MILVTTVGHTFQNGKSDTVAIDMHTRIFVVLFAGIIKIASNIETTVRSLAGSDLLD
jgi:hypothetical protein